MGLEALTIINLFSPWQNDRTLEFNSMIYSKKIVAIRRFT